MEATRPGAPARALARLERGLIALSQAAIALIMLVVVADVAMRYLVHRPLSWSYDLIGSYLMVAAFFLALPDTLAAREHIAIDMLAPRLHRRILHPGLALGYALSAVLVAIIAVQGWDRCVQAFRAGDLVSATVPWPTWPTHLVVALGAAVMALRCLVLAAGHMASLVTGRDHVDPPRPPDAPAPPAPPVPTGGDAP